MILLVAIAAIGIGNGVGVTAKRYSLSASLSSAVLISTLPQHEILNDSSLEIVTLRSGDRRMFFQDNTGRIKQAEYMSEFKQCSVALQTVVAPDEIITSLLQLSMFQ